MKILITGCNGQLGTEMRLLAKKHATHSYVFSDINIPQNADSQTVTIDITNKHDLAYFVDNERVDLIVNCAAYTNVDKAEDDAVAAHRLNVDAVQYIGECPCKVIHISTDYVFDGLAHYPYNEEDSVCPNTVYGKTKLLGEQKLLAVKPDAIIFRTSWLYSPFGNNFVKTMLRLGKEKVALGVVFDQIGTPTYAGDLAEAIFVAIESAQWRGGIYHFSNEGICSWYDFTHEIFRQYNALHPESPITAHVNAIHSSEYQYRTPRPFFSVLDKSKYKRVFGGTVAHWTEALNRCLKKL